MTSLTKIENMPLEYTQDKIELLKNTVCKGATNSEFQLFLHVCQRTGLDPFIKQIHAVKRPERQKDGTYRESMTIQVGIDGYRSIAERTGRYAPSKEPSYQYDKDGRIFSSTAYLKKQTSDGTWHEVSATAFYTEYVQKTKEGKATRFWDQMPHGQLAKCAEALALRKAFPMELSGIYTREEMAQSEVVEEAVEVKDEEASADQTEQFDTLLKVKGLNEEKVQQFLDQVSSTYKKSNGYIILKWLQDMDKFEANLTKWLEKNP